MLQFILVANDAYSATGSTISAYRIANERLKRTMWPIYKGTRNRMAISASDRILVYLEGIKEFSQTFVAHAEVEKLEEVGRHVTAVDPEDILTLTAPPYRVLRMKNVVRLLPPVEIRPIKDRLSFLPKSNRWRAALERVGCKRIPASDFEVVVSQRNRKS